ncbi:ankyrin [Penicillium tannophilum]|nr:ankyrin [Penicillium tannophilum]
MIEMYEEYTDRERHPSPTRIMEVFCDVVKSYDQVFIVVDGIDEMSGSQHSQHKLLDQIFTLQERTQRVKLFATSRPLPEIEARFKENGILRIEIRADQQDLALYVKGRLRGMPLFVRERKILQDEVKEKVTKNTGGM